MVGMLVYIILLDHFLLLAVLNMLIILGCWSILWDCAIMTY